MPVEGPPPVRRVNQKEQSDIIVAARPEDSWTYRGEAPTSRPRMEHDFRNALMELVWALRRGDEDDLAIQSRAEELMSMYRQRSRC